MFGLWSQSVNYVPLKRRIGDSIDVNDPVKDLPAKCLLLAKKMASNLTFSASKYEKTQTLGTTPKYGGHWTPLWGSVLGGHPSML